MLISPSCSDLGCGSFSFLSLLTLASPCISTSSKGFRPRPRNPQPGLQNTPEPRVYDFLHTVLLLQAPGPCCDTDEVHEYEMRCKQNYPNERNVSPGNNASQQQSAHLVSECQGTFFFTGGVNKAHSLVRRKWHRNSYLREVCS